MRAASVWSGASAVQGQDGEGAPGPTEPGLAAGSRMTHCKAFRCELWAGGAVPSWISFLSQQAGNHALSAIKHSPSTTSLAGDLC